MKKLFCKNKIIIIFVIILFFNQKINANTYTVLNDIISTKKDTTQYIFPKNYLYFEFYGLTMFYSVNYERSLFSKNNNNFSIRLGCSIIPIPGYLLMYPVSINYYTFINKKILINIGTSIVYIPNGTYKYYGAVNANILYFFTEKTFLKCSVIRFFEPPGPNYGFGVSIGFKFGKH